MPADDVATYGVAETRLVEDETDARIEELDYNGYTVIESGLGAAELEAIRERIDRNYDLQAAASAAEGALPENDVDILRCPLAYDEMFLRLATSAPLMELCRRVLGPHYVLLQQNGIINRPQSKPFQARWHRDLGYQHLVVSRKIAINALFCVDHFSFETGGTVVLPGTHLHERFPSAPFVQKFERTVEARAGSFLVLDTLLYHRAGYNISAGARRGVNHMIGRPILAQQLDIPRLLEGRYSEDGFLRRYLGYQWNPASDVVAWRTLRA
jgi:ectoine hydroxylase-related dioxygenase (phytanoyl-CoA dioxygenase family)